MKIEILIPGGKIMAKTIEFFLGANSADGFCSLYDQLGREEDTYDLIILKGGPGVGKSTFMKYIGAQAEEKGLDVEYIRCSGDPKSLDAVLLPALQTAVVDGTAPHGAVLLRHRRIFFGQALRENFSCGGGKRKNSAAVPRSKRTYRRV